MAAQPSILNLVELPLLGWFGPLVPGGGLDRVVDAAGIKYPPAAFPANADQWADTYEILAPSAIWTGQETAAPSIDRVGAQDLEDVVGTPDFAQGGEGGRRAILLDGAEALRVLDTTFLDSDAATSISIWIRAFIPAALSATRSIGGKRGLGPADDGHHFRLTSTGVAAYFVGDSTTNAQPTVAGHLNAWHNFVGVLDRDLDEVRLTTDLGSQVADASAVGSISNAEPLSIGQAASEEPEGLLVTYVAAWHGYALTGAEAAELAAVTP